MIPVSFCSSALDALDLIISKRHFDDLFFIDIVSAIAKAPSMNKVGIAGAVEATSTIISGVALIVQ